MKDALRYAEACLKQGLTYTGAANASGVSEQDLRQFLPGYTRPVLDSEIESDPFIVCASVLARASAVDVRRVAALALRLVASQSGYKEARNVMNNIWDALPDVDTTVPRAAIMNMIDEVAKTHGTTRDHILSTRKYTAAARQEVMWRMYNEFKMSMPKIAAFIKRDHTTVSYGIKRHEQRTDHRPRGA